MELSADFIAIQGILSSLIKTTGEFTKINYRGGNEEKILLIMNELKKYLVSKSYIKNDTINEVFDKQLEDIVIFLAINTNYKHKHEFEEYAHLLNIIPPLTKCILANVVYGLDLCKYYCTAIERLPLEVGNELLEEMLPCLKKTVPKLQLKYSEMFIKTAARKLETVDYSSKTEDDIYNITEVTDMILRNLTGIYSGQTKNMNAMKIYEHMGHCLSSLFDILLTCNKNCITLKKLIRNIARTCCSIIQNVTLNVFCAWAELEIEDEVFQTIISEKAYRVLEAYQKDPDAIELISLLATIARKPLTFSELIGKSDTSTIIKKIDKSDMDQKKWFRALLTIPEFFKNKEAVDCVNKWSQLCNEEDVMILLNLCIQTRDGTAKKLVIKCASSLSLEQLNTILSRHFYRNKFTDVLGENIEPNLMVIFNKMENSQAKPDLTFELSLLLFQNPLVFYKYIYRECFKNIYYTDCLKDLFLNIKEISGIDDVGIKTLYEVLTEEKLEQQKSNNIAYLLKKLLEIGYFNNNILTKALYPLVKKFYSEKQSEDLYFGLQIILDSKLMVPVTNENCQFLETCLEIMKENRCKFLNFVNLNQDIVKSVVDIFLDSCEIKDCLPPEAFEMATDDIFTNYYKNYLSANIREPFFKSICPEFNIKNEGNCVSQLLQILTSSVPKEWMNVCDEIQKQHGAQKCIELLTDTMILLAQLVETQDIENNKFVYSGLKYYISCFGLLIQKIQKGSDLDIEIVVTRQVCRLITKLPASIKEVEGLSLINVLTQSSLKVLGKDKEFLCLLILIKNSTICKVLAEKIKQ